MSDYLKGCVTKQVMQTAVSAGAERGAPVLVDPKIPHLDYYSGATIVTPEPSRSRGRHATGACEARRRRAMPHDSFVSARTAATC